MGGGGFDSLQLTTKVFKVYAVVAIFNASNLKTSIMHHAEGKKVRGFANPNGTSVGRISQGVESNGQALRGATSDAKPFRGDGDIWGVELGQKGSQWNKKTVMTPIRSILKGRCRQGRVRQHRSSSLQNHVRG